MKLSSFAIDSKRAENGDWVPVAAIPGVSFKVRGRSTLAAKALRARLSAGIPVEDRGDPEKMLRHAMDMDLQVILSCLDDWRGLEDDDGTPLAYSKELAEKLILDPDFINLAMIIGGACDAVAERRAEATKDAIKN